jgi:hypothetical protein
VPTIRWSYIAAFLFSLALLGLFVLMRAWDIGDDTERGALLYVFFAINATLGTITIRALNAATPGVHSAGDLPISHILPGNGHSNGDGQQSDTNTVNGTNSG